MAHAALLAGLLAGAAHAAPQPATVAAGQTTFQNNCTSCHSVDPNLSSRAGPGPFRVVGRKAAGVPGFNYSAALTKAGAAGKTCTSPTSIRWCASRIKTAPNPITRREVFAACSLLGLFAIAAIDQVSRT